MSFRIRVDVLSTQARRRLTDLEHRAEYLQPILRYGASVLAGELHRNFRSRGREIGRPWPNRKDGSSATLVRTGGLEAAIANKQRTTKTMGIAGISGPEAAVARFHQGGTSRGLPARPIVGASDRTRSALVESVERYLLHGTV